MQISEEAFLITKKGILKEIYVIGKGFMDSQAQYAFLDPNFHKRVDLVNKGIKKRQKKTNFAGEWLWFESENYSKSEDSKSMAQRDNEFETVSFSSELNDNDTSNLTAMINQLGVDSLFRNALKMKKKKSSK